MQFIDLISQQKQIREKIETRISGVLDHGKYIMGPEVSELETRLADFSGVRYAVSCSSGTDALLMALMAYGIGPGDAVLTTPFTFIASAEVIALAGATPVFVDIDPKTFNIDPEKIESTIADIKKGKQKNLYLPASPESKAVLKGIIPVDLFGLAADYDRINAIARQHNLFVIEDAAQSFGGLYKNNKTCSLADAGCTSFFPAKPLGCYGDGGAIFTNNEQLAEKIISIRVHGKGIHKYDNVRIGINGRMDTIQAAILLAKLDIFSEEIDLRQTVAQRYQELLSSQSDLILPFIPNDRQSVWAQYSILAKTEAHRESILKNLQKAGIPAAIYYPKPLHIQEAFAYLGYQKGDFPVSEDISRRIFSLPMHPYMIQEDQERIAEVMKIQ